MRGNYSCEGVFFNDDGKSLALSPALFISFGLYSPLFSRFLGFAAAFNRHFRADSRLCYGI